jgi:acyl carrier protein
MLDNIASPRLARISKVVVNVLAAESQLDDLPVDQDLREAGMTSLNMVTLMIAVEGEFGLVIPKHELHPDNFKSIRSVDKMLSRLDSDASRAR